MTFVRTQDAPCIYYCNLTWACIPGDRRNPPVFYDKYEPYDLVVVQRSQIHAEHFTISSSGVTHIAPDYPSEVCLYHPPPPIPSLKHLEHLQHRCGWYSPCTPFTHCTP
eukprot:5740667-Pyramimonas_sp.AAC.1